MTGADQSRCFRGDRRRPCGGLLGVSVQSNENANTPI
jgi:hypothetical protein